MSDLSLDKIKNMLGAHNDGVYRLEARSNLGEIVEWLMEELEAAHHDVEVLSASRQEFVEENETLRNICVQAQADYRGMAHTFATYGFYASRKEALETADYIKKMLDGGTEEPTV